MTDNFRPARRICRQLAIPANWTGGANAGHFLDSAADRVAMIVSLVRPENAPSSDVFGHNRQRPSQHENVGRYFDSGAAHDFGSGLH